MSVTDLILLLTTLITSKIARDESLQRLFACREGLLAVPEYLRLQSEYHAAIDRCCKKKRDYKKVVNDFVKRRKSLQNEIINMEENAGKMDETLRHKKRDSILTQLRHLDERTPFSTEYHALQDYLSTNCIVTPADMLSNIGRVACMSGHSFEKDVVLVLEAKGWTILGKSINLESVPGEIDIVASPPGKPNLIFVIEVKRSFGDVINLDKKRKQVEAYIREKYADRTDVEFRFAYIVPEKIPESLNSLSSKLWGIYLHRFATSLDPSLQIAQDGKITFPEGQDFSTKWHTLFLNFTKEVKAYAHIRSQFDDGLQIDTVYLYSLV